jgi:chemotaxis signal transduction protein
MNAGSEKSYVLFPMGEKRFALPSQVVTELARPDHLQTFPHGTPLLAGVLVRRGRIVPVYDVAQILVGPMAPPRKFYLIANRQIDARNEWTAIPVTGECELANLKPAEFDRGGEDSRQDDPRDGRPDYVIGMVAAGDEAVAVVDLEKLINTEAR